jgi:Tripartite tricarboxylate transporter family receptor
MIVEDQPDRGSGRVGSVEKLEEFDELAAAVTILDQGVNLAGDEINPGQQTDLVRSPYVMVVNPSVPAKTVPEFVAYAKANPDKINMGSSGNGSTPHVYGELFKAMAGVDMVHVPYRGNYLPDLLGGQVQVAFAPLPSSIEFIRTGRRSRLCRGQERSDRIPLGAR